MNELSATSEAALLMGGEEVEISYRDKRKGKETVLVRDLSVKFYPKYFESLDDDEKRAELFCDKPAGWAESLTGKSLSKVIAAGEALNHEPFFEWCGRRFDLKKRKDVIFAPLKEAIDAAAKASKPGSATGSPKSAN